MYSTYWSVSISFCVYLCVHQCILKGAEGWGGGGVIQLKASDSEQRSLKAGGASHIKQNAASKRLYRICLIEEKDFKHSPKLVDN